MGSLNLLFPFTYCFILIGSFSLIAFPFFTGFYSKDLLIELAILPVNITTTIASLFLIIGAIFTALYSVRLLIITFLAAPILNYTSFRFELYLFLPLAILSILAVYFGFLAHELFLSHDLFALPVHAIRASIAPAPFLIQVIPLIALIPLAALLPHSFPHTLSTIHLPFRTNLLANWNNYNAQAILVTQTFAIIIARYFDRGFLELILGPFGLLRLFHFFSFTLELLATGLPHYAIILLLISLSILITCSLSFMAIAIYIFPYLPFIISPLICHLLLNDGWSSFASSIFPYWLYTSY
jgi:NADH-ubiquinone oxidoreductase chain 5